MKKNLLFFFFILVISASNFLSAQITCDPVIPTDESSVVVTFDATQGSAGLKGYAGDVYVHIGVLTNLSSGAGDWKYVKTNWGVNTPETKLTKISTDTYTLSITPSIRAYFGVPAGETILKMAFVFRSGVQVNGSYLEGKTTAGGDIFYDVVPSGLNVRITSPSSTTPLVDYNSAISVNVTANKSTGISLLFDNVQIASSTNSTLSTVCISSSYGKHWLKAIATDGTKSVADSVYFYVRKTVTVAELPAGIVPGINYLNDNSVTLVLFDPLGLKKFAFVIGDFNNWEIDDNYYMNRTSDGKYYWLTINNLIAGKEYLFQYFVDGQLRLADPYCEKISDPWNDKYIPSTTYPNLIQYPAGNKTTGVASVLQTAQQPYQWSATNFQPPDKSDMVIYELHIRDFVESHYIKNVMDSLNYLQKLGVNVIELMPINEFDGNDSWGYNPNFYFATDKAYGTKNDYKKFIDECHKRGIAVIIDMVLNHSWGLSPMVQMYWDPTNNRPAANNPWYNPVATHPYSVGNDFNHESPYTKEFVKRVLKFWIDEYKIDGYRFDLSKGFTQTNNPNDVGAWGNYDQSRINIWKDYSDAMKAAKSDIYIILEHFAANTEEQALTGYGMMTWGNMNYNFGEAAMSWIANSDFSGLSYKSRGFSIPNLVGYMESHDEERLMYKCLTFGKSDVASYNIRDISVALQRMELDAAFFFTMPGPKMIWQFGELGYDINIDFNGRTGAKPIHWNYLSDNKRKHLLAVYSALIDIKKKYPVFKTTDFSSSLNAEGKRINLNSASGNVTLIGNFDVITASVSPNFQHTGWWYDFMTGDSLQVSSVSASINLKQGEFRIYYDKRVKRIASDFPLAIESIEINANKLCSLYPNPASNEMTISVDNSKSEKYNLTIYSLLGQAVKTFQLNNRNTIIWNLTDNNGNRLPAGVYIYKVISGQTGDSGKIIIK